jgi:DedD protein
MVEKLKKKSSSSSSLKKEEHPVQVVDKEIEQIQEAKKVIPAKKPPVIKPAKQKTEVKKKSSIIQKEPTRLTPKSKPKSVSKPVAKHAPKVVPIKSANAVPNYYIQVGATSTTPSKAYLKKIVDAGFIYTLYETTVKGKKVTKILVGPYKGHSKAKMALPQVRKKIARGAFIYRIK